MTESLRGCAHREVPARLGLSRPARPALKPLLTGNMIGTIGGPAMPRSNLSAHPLQSLSTRVHVTSSAEVVKAVCRCCAFSV